jgi:hypothetical protein
MMGWAAIEDFPCLEDRTSTPWRPDGLCSGRGQWLPVLFRMGRATDCREDASPSLPCHRCSGCTSPCGHAPCWWDRPHTPSTTSWACGDCTTNFSVGGCVVAGRGCVPRRPTSNSILPPKVENEVVSRPVPRESSPSRAGRTCGHYLRAEDVTLQGPAALLIDQLGLPSVAELSVKRVWPEPSAFIT